MTLAGRTLYKDGKWNTLCLPFDVDMTDPDGPLYGATYRTVTAASIEGTTLNLTFRKSWNDDPEMENTLFAGVPYIIKWDKAADYVDDDAHNIVNPVFVGPVFRASLPLKLNYPKNQAVGSQKVANVSDPH
ncbi:MAG: hypothetical protein IKO12_08365 [Bacteroidaceae bacterium]|nr:hypothetical protein [Bacteroidaceae bacterium]